ncbi:MAG: serine hydrolase, partial [Nakamurella sp.]
TAGTTSSPPSPQGCPSVDSPDTSTAAGWLGYLAAHQADISLTIEDGRGAFVEHRAQEPAPAASAAKVVHLLAYAAAVNAGRFSPDQPVPIADWEAWYLPGLDGGAHGAALQAIGVANDGVRAADPAGTVRMDDIVAAMIEFSDNAAADYLRHLLGDASLRAAGAAGGAAELELPSYLGEAIALLVPADAPKPGLSRPDRAAVQLALAQRYMSDPHYRVRVQATPAPALAAQQEWAESTTATTALALAALHKKLSTTASEDPTDVGAADARRQLEWPPVPPGAIALGVKGGAYPGVINEAMTLRRQDGTTAVAVLLVRRMPADAWTAGLTSFAHQELLLAALQDPAILDRLSCAVGGGSTIPR